MLRVRKGDNVKIISGKDKGRDGKVLKVYPKDNLVLIEGLNLRKRHQRPRRAGEKGSIVQIPTPLDSSKVMPQCPHCQKATRISVKLDGEGNKKRVCKKCHHEF